MFCGCWRQNQAEASIELWYCTNEKTLNKHTLRCTTNSKTSKCFWHLDHTWSYKKKKKKCSSTLTDFEAGRFNLLTCHMNCNIIQADGLHTWHNWSSRSSFEWEQHILWKSIYFKLKVMGNLLSLAQGIPAVILQTVQSILSINNIFLSYTHTQYIRNYLRVI